MRGRRAPVNAEGRWRAAASPGGLIGILALIIVVVLIGGALLVLAGRADLPLPSAVVLAGLILLVVAGLALAYLVYGYATISYELTARTLAIRWGRERHVVDLESIRQIGPAAEHLDHPGRWQRFWTGYYVGDRGSADGPVQVVATLPLRRQLLVNAGDRRFAISPERPVLFVEEYGRLRRALDAQHTGGFPTVQPGETAERLARAGWTMQYPTIGSRADRPAPKTPPIPGRPPAGEPAEEEPRDANGGVSPLLRPVLLNDPLAVGLLAVAVLLNVVMVTYILTQFESLPSAIVLHWNVNGNPDRIGSPREIWTLPIITGLVTIANLGLAWSVVTFDRFAARFLLASTCLVQMVAWVALLTLIR